MSKEDAVIPTWNHKGKKDQKYDPKMWDKALELRMRNDKPCEKWTLNRIAEKTGYQKAP